MTKNTTIDEKQLVRYLLGQLGPDEQARIEELYLADPDIHEELRAVERDLIDQYVHGALADRAAFEAHFLTSPRRRERVEFARALMQSLSPAPVVDSSRALEREPWLAATRRFLRPSPLTWRLAGAMLIVLVGAWLLLSRWRQPAPETEVAHRPQPPTQVVPLEPPPSPPSSVAPLPAQPPSVVMAILVLAPGSTRNGDETPTLTIGKAAQVRLALHLEPGDYRSYEATIRTPEGKAVWSAQRLRLENTSSGRAVVVRLPAARFTSNDYTVTLRGVTAAGEVDEVGSYYFRVKEPSR